MEHGAVAVAVQTEFPASYMYTLSGIYHPLAPCVEEVNIDDISHHLAFQCRYNGACEHYYSVAEHSFWCSTMVPPQYALEALLHDAAEAYLGDIIRPLKRMPQFAKYRELEELNERVIAKAFNLTYPWPACVKEADEDIATLEVTTIIKSEAHNYCVNGVVPKNVHLACWSPNYAKLKFRERYRVLSQVRAQLGG
jgi:hypothetical protein